MNYRHPVVTRLALALVVSIKFCCGFSLTGNSHQTMGQDRKDFVSKASFVVGTYQPKKSDHSAKDQAHKANLFLKSLSPAQSKQATGPLQGEIRRQWTNLPARPDADGIRLGLLTEPQLKAACDLMAALFSEQGYAKMVQIMLADDQLLRGGRRRAGFGTEDFAIVIFGKPSDSQPWGFQLDGHHVGVNLSLEGDAVSMSPSFIGTQPQSFKIGSKSFRPLAHEMDGAYELVNSLTFEQLQTGIISDTRGSIRLGPGQDGRVPRRVGVKCSSFNEKQAELLLTLIKQWVGNLPAKQATKRMNEIKKGLDRTYFAWSGDKKPKSDVSFVIHGPTLIIEYACQDLGGDPLNHLHSVYRNPQNEYGGQLK